MAEAGNEARPRARWGPRARLRLRLGLWLISRHDRGYRPHRLPSIRSQARSTGVHRNTVAAAYHDLERFGLVRCVQGKGTFARLPAYPHGRPGEPLRMAADLVDALRRELEADERSEERSAPRPYREPARSGLLLLPLDETPNGDAHIVPLAPRGAALTAMARLRPGSNVRLVSRSPSIARLVRHTLLVLHGTTVGMGRVGCVPRPTAPAETTPVTWDLTLLDASQPGWFAAARGTPAGREAFVPLRLLTSGSHPCG